MREEVESPDLDLGSAIGDVSRSLDSLLIGNLGVVSGSTPLESLIGSIGAGLDTKALIGELGAGLDPPPLGSLIGSIGAGLDAKPFDLRLYQPLAGGVTAEPSLALPESVVGGVVPIPSPECWALNTGVLAERPLTSEDDGDTDASLECALDRIDPAFATQSRGAMLRSEERGADWLTQAAALLRKLLLGVLHTVAPNS